MRMAAPLASKLTTFMMLRVTAQQAPGGHPNARDRCGHENVATARAGPSGNNPKKTANAVNKPISAAASAMPGALDGLAGGPAGGRWPAGVPVWWRLSVRLVLRAPQGGSGIHGGGAAVDRRLRRAGPTAERRADSFQPLDLRDHSNSCRS
jgi:hypothetical protein